MALETQKWLVWLGIKSSTSSKSIVQGEVQHLKESVGNYNSFQNLVGTDTSYSDFKTSLKDNGWSQSEADTFVSKIKDTFSDKDASGTTWDEFDDYVLNQTDTYTAFKSKFGNTSGTFSSTTTEDGEPAAGVRIHDTPGTSYDNVDVPAGTAEIFGRRVEFSQQVSSADRASITYSNLSTNDADNSLDSGESITISADANNPNGWQVSVSVPYLEDGSVIQQKEVSIGANSVKTVSFTVSKTEYICVDAAIADLSPVTICWTPSTLTS